jgi:hypothetical protein
MNPHTPKNPNINKEFVEVKSTTFDANEIHKNITSQPYNIHMDINKLETLQRKVSQKAKTKSLLKVS